MAIPRARSAAQATIEAPYLTVGSHTRLDVDPGGDWIAKPNPNDSGLEPTHLQMQAIGENVRYTLDASQATATHGFRLTAAAAAVIVPVPNGGVSVFEEASGAIVQYQWLA